MAGSGGWAGFDCLEGPGLGPASPGRLQTGEMGRGRGGPAAGRSLVPAPGLTRTHVLAVTAVTAVAEV